MKKHRCGYCEKMFPEDKMIPQFGGVSGKPWWICEKCDRRRGPKWFG